MGAEQALLWHLRSGQAHSAQAVGRRQEGHSLRHRYRPGQRHRTSVEGIQVLVVLIEKVLNSINFWAVFVNAVSLLFKEFLF